MDGSTALHSPAAGRFLNTVSEIVGMKYHELKQARGTQQLKEPYGEKWYLL